MDHVAVKLKKILIYNSGGGLGDSIQIIDLILSLQNYYKDCELFYLGAHKNHFEGKLKEFNIEIQTLDLKLTYFGFRWWHYFLVKKRFLNNDIEEIDLIIDLQSKFRNTLILKRIPHQNFYSSTYNYKFCTKKVDFVSKNHLENLRIFLNVNIKSLSFNFKSLSEKLKSEAKRLLPDRNYIGFSVTQGNIYRKKSWSLDNFINLAIKISEKNKVPVFFIEKDHEKLIEKIKAAVPNALFPEQHSKLACPALVTALSKRLNLAITIDNGIMHMIGLANIPMIVLFGPTDSEKFSPKGEKIQILDSKKIYNSKNINKITVYDVFKLI